MIIIFSGFSDRAPVDDGFNGINAVMYTNRKGPSLPRLARSAHEKCNSANWSVPTKHNSTVARIFAVMPLSKTVLRRSEVAVRSHYISEWCADFSLAALSPTESVVQMVGFWEA